jgi:hypothetical protein
MWFFSVDVRTCNVILLEKQDNVRIAAYQSDVNKKIEGTQLRKTKPSNHD